LELIRAAVFRKPPTESIRQGLEISER